ncbi:hypothetical protein [Actinoplanes sp. NPDC023714]|uniref:hypothetical protein n=1 Tax=Actinoplanes sp. NPDC023714 TaxID=3154322 RepID=UPI0034105217
MGDLPSGGFGRDDQLVVFWDSDSGDDDAAPDGGGRRWRGLVALFGLLAALALGGAAVLGRLFVVTVEALEPESVPEPEAASMVGEWCSGQGDRLILGLSRFTVEPLSADFAGEVVGRAAGNVPVSGSGLWEVGLGPDEATAEVTIEFTRLGVQAVATERLVFHVRDGNLILNELVFRRCGQAPWGR